MSERKRNALILFLLGTSLVVLDIMMEVHGTNGNSLAILGGVCWGGALYLVTSN